MRRVAWAILLLVAISAAVTARVVWAGEREIAASTDALKGGDADAAIVHARAAAYWYAPGAPHVRVAYERLFALAEEAEKRRLWATALFAYRAVISASASTTWLVTPHAEDAREAERAVARLEAKIGERAPNASTEPAEAIEAKLLEELAAKQGPTARARALLAGSFAAMIGGLASLLGLGLDESGRLRLGRAVPALVAAVAGFALWCVSLFLA
jgi:hypothetical protein